MKALRPEGRPPSRLAELAGWIAYRFFQALPFWGKPDLAFLDPGPEAAHTAHAIEVPLGDQTMPGRWLQPKAGTGAAVLFLHGAAAEALPPYTFAMQALIDRGIAVMTIEMDGHGNNPRAFDPARLAENVPAALDALFAMPGVDADRVGILGVSLGGACALHGAAQRQGIRTMAAVGLPLSLSIGRRQQLVEMLGLFSPHSAAISLKMAPDRLVSFLVKPLRVAAEGEVVRRYILDLETPRVIDAALRHLAPLSHLERLEDVSLLLITGAWDRVAPLEHARALHAAAPERVTLAVAPARNHFSIVTSPFTVRTLADWFEQELVLAVTPTKELSDEKDHTAQAADSIA